MKYFKLIVIFCIFPMVACSVQAEPDEFTKKLNRFRYSLYQDIENVPDSSLFSDSFYGMTEIDAKCNRFLNENTKAIHQYKEKKIKAHEVNTLPALSEYIPQDEEFIKQMNETFSFIYSEGITEFNSAAFPQSYWHIQTINPFDRASIYINMIRSQLGGNVLLSAEAIRNTIGIPLTYSKKLDNSSWQLYIDTYRYIYVFRYELNKDILILENIYSRAKTNSQDSV